MANPMGPVLSHHTSQERQPATVPELQGNKPHQSPKQSHAEDHTEQIEATTEKIIFEEQAGFRAEERQILNRWTEYCSELYNCKTNGDPQSRSSTYAFYVRNISSNSKTSTKSS